jgi:hypothetical protein
MNSASNCTDSNITTLSNYPTLLSHLRKKYAVSYDKTVYRPSKQKENTLAIKSKESKQNQLMCVVFQESTALLDILKHCLSGTDRLFLREAAYKIIVHKMLCLKQKEFTSFCQEQNLITSDLVFIFCLVLESGNTQLCALQTSENPLNICLIQSCCIYP